jgi:hypothetical protein
LGLDVNPLKPFIPSEKRLAFLSESLLDNLSEARNLSINIVLYTDRYILPTSPTVQVVIARVHNLCVGIGENGYLSGLPFVSEEMGER